MQCTASSTDACVHSTGKALLRSLGATEHFGKNRNVLSVCKRRPAHIKAYAFVFAKTHDANHWRKSFLLANRESQNFYLAFTGGARSPLVLRFLRLARNPPLHASNLSLPSRPFFPLLFLFFSSFTSLIKKSKKKRFN